MKEEFNLELFKEMVNDLYKKDKELPRQRVQLPAAYGASLNCEELKSFAGSKNFMFIGGLESINKLVEKCKECGIEY